MTLTNMGTIETLKNVIHSAFGTIPTAEDILTDIKKEQAENILDAISYVGEGNIHLQQKRILFQEDIDKIKEEVLSFTFPKV